MKTTPYTTGMASKIKNVNTLSHCEFGILEMLDSPEWTQDNAFSIIGYTFFHIHVIGHGPKNTHSGNILWRARPTLY